MKHVFEFVYGANLPRQLISKIQIFKFWATLGSITLLVITGNKVTARKYLTVQFSFLNQEREGYEKNAVKSV